MSLTGPAVPQSRSLESDSESEQVTAGSSFIKIVKLRSGTGVVTNTSSTTGTGTISNANTNPLGQSEFQSLPSALVQES